MVEQILYGLVGHSISAFAIVMVAYFLLKEFIKERVKKWDEASSQIVTHDATCTERYDHISTQLANISGGQARIETTVSEHGKKLETLSTTVATMSGRQEERDRRAQAY